MSIRLRLALVYAAVLGLTLILSSLLIYAIMVRHFLDEADKSVESYAHHIASTINFPGAQGGRPASLHDLLLPPIDAFASPEIYVQITTPEGQPIARSSNLEGRELPAALTLREAGQVEQAKFTTSRLGSEEVRVYLRPLQVESRLLGYVLVARSYRGDQATLGSLRLAMLGVGALSLFAAGAVSWAVAGRALRPVAALTQTAEEIALSRSFSRKIPHAEDRDELGLLARTFDEMLGSLEEAYAAQQRFVADASHELRTPLTAVRGNLELLKEKGEELPRGERLALIGAASTEAERMARLVADLLSLARADAGQRLVVRPVELDQVLLEVFRQARILAKGVKVSIRELDQLAVPGDPDRLTQLLLTLVDNALKYTPAGGQVTLGIRREGKFARVEVVDTGIGIAKEDLPHIFERFYRADRARSREAGGCGLGLAIAQWIAREHGGEITVRSALGRGSTFTVRLPLVD